MIYWILVIIFVVGVALVAVGSHSWDSDKHPFLWYNDDKIGAIGAAITLLSAIIIIIMTIVIIFNNSGVTAQRVKLEQTYQALTYKLEEGDCRDELGLLNKEVIDEVQEWNEDISYGKAIQRDFWLGIFTPNIYDDLDLIDYNKLNVMKG